MASVKLELKLSQHAQDFMLAATDLLQVILEADEVLVTDEIREAADVLLKVIERGRGEF